jgi:hypothetical protein
MIDCPTCGKTLRLRGLRRKIPAKRAAASSDWIISKGTVWQFPLLNSFGHPFKWPIARNLIDESVGRPDLCAKFFAGHQIAWTFQESPKYLQRLPLLPSRLANPRGLWFRRTRRSGQMGASPTLTPRSSIPPNEKEDAPSLRFLQGWAVVCS